MPVRPSPLAIGLRPALWLTALLCACPRGLAGGTPENAILVVDPTNPESLYVANYYRQKRDLPDVNVVYMSPTPATYAQFAGATLDAFLGALENLGIGDHVDYVILPSGGTFYTSAPGLVTDGCYSVSRFSATAPYALAHQRAQILAGTDSSLPNGYYRPSDEARAFDGSIQWGSGEPLTVGGQRYFIAAMLGYTGPLGNTLPEVLAMIDRSLAVDATRPAGTFYFMQTSDPARSGPRQGAFPAAVAAIIAFGGNAQHLFADFPLGNFDCMGIMTGLADPDIDNANLGVLAGAFCDHLTSYAATFDSSSQTKMSRWISKGASGTSGTVEEPCNYPGKFAHARLHVFYFQGLSLGEAWFRSMGFAPFQSLFLGDPLTRPFAYLPTVDLAGVAAGPMSDTVALTPTATTTHPTAHIASFDLLVDGIWRSTCLPGGHFALDTTALADGYHEWRVLAYDDTLVRSVGRRSGAIWVSNRGRSALLSPLAASGDLTTRFDFTVSAGGGTVQELRLLQGSRVVAASAVSPATLSVYGRNLGAGTVRLELEAQFSDGARARSAPADVTIAYSSGALSGTAPVAHGYTKRVLATQAAVVELPASFDDDLPTASFSLLSNPAQAAVIGGGSGPYRIVRPNAGASGSDAVTFQVTTPSGTSNVATVTIVYDAPLSCPPPANYCVTSPNSVGAGAVMDWSGEASLGANDFQLFAYGCPPNKTGIFFYGNDAAQIPLGNGFRCVASPIHRLGAITTDAFGDAFRQLDFTLPPMRSGSGAITTGSTKRFQLWYRDPAAGGARTNLTDGLAVTFCP
jgi:hypothetical protein